jgi:hypothetical protein
MFSLSRYALFETVTYLFEQNAHVFSELTA